MPGLQRLSGEFFHSDDAPVLGTSYLFFTTYTYSRRLPGRFGPKSRRLPGLASRCLPVENSTESQGFVQSHARGAERPQEPRSAGAWKGFIRHAVAPSWGHPQAGLAFTYSRVGRREPAGRYSLRLSCVGAMRGGDGETTSAPLTVRQCRSGHAVWIFFSSRRQSVRKASTVRVSPALAGFAPNCR